MKDDQNPIDVAASYLAKTFSNSEHIEFWEGISNQKDASNELKLLAAFAIKMLNMPQPTNQAAPVEPTVEVNPFTLKLDIDKIDSVEGYDKLSLELQTAFPELDWDSEAEEGKLFSFIQSKNRGKPVAWQVQCDKIDNDSDLATSVRLWFENRGFVPKK